MSDQFTSPAIGKAQPRKTLSKLTIVGLALIGAIMLALMSAYVERIGPELVQYGNLCGASTSDPCYRPALKGGFPVAFLFDKPGVSREGQLAFIEDNLHIDGVLIDIAIYFAILMLSMWGISRRAWWQSGAK